MDNETPAPAHRFIQIAGIAALSLVVIQAYYFVTFLIEILGDGMGGMLFRILLSNTPFYLSGALFLAGGYGLISQRNWGWILVIGAAAFRLLNILYRWFLIGEVDLFQLDSFTDIFYPISFGLFILIIVLLLLPATRRALEIEIGNIGFAFMVPAVLFTLQAFLQLMGSYIGY